MKGGKNKSKADVDEFDEFDDLVVPKSKKPPANKAKGTFTSARRGPPVRTPAAAPINHNQTFSDFPRPARKQSINESSRQASEQAWSRLGTLGLGLGLTWA